jgi:DNA-binding response OmpR family regulator
MLPATAGIRGEWRMAGRRPTILVVGDDRDERAAIAAVLHEAGFAVAAARDRGARALLTRRRFAAAVVALPEDGGVEFQRHLRRRHPGLPAFIVIAPEAIRFVDAGEDTLVPRPLDACHLLGRVFELVLREREDGTPHHSEAAELGIAAARLACLDNRRSAAAAAGAQALAHDLTRPIGRGHANHRGLAAASTIGD